MTLESVIFYLGLIIGLPSVAIVGGKWYWQYRLSLEKQYRRDEREEQKPENQINKFDKYIDDLPAILEQRMKDYDQIVSQHGADDPIAKSFKQQIDLLKYGASIPAPILHMAKPILVKIIKAIGSFSI